VVRAIWRIVLNAAQKNRREHRAGLNDGEIPPVLTAARGS